MAEDGAPGEFEEISTSFNVSFPSVPDNFFDGVTPREIIMGESLLTPGLQTSIKLQSEVLVDVNKKMWERLKETPVKIHVEKQGLKKFGYKETMDVAQTVYRLGGRSSSTPSTTDNRKLVGRTVEELVFHACDPTLLNDAASLVSNIWKCTTPSAIVQEVLQTCAGARKVSVESSNPARDYKAENIHPFQVVNQQASAALADSNDPSFIHYMTYEGSEDGQGTHHFKSLHNLVKGSNILKKPLEYSRAAMSLRDPDSIMNYVFPCDFDVLSDILNGIGRGGNINSVAIVNPLNRTFSLMGNESQGCGIGGGVHKVVMSNQGTAGQQAGCPDFSYIYAQKRQARMGLLEKDKIALRMVVPWNPIYHAGNVVKVALKNPEIKDQLLYGSGDYLIVSMTHTLKEGGYGITTLDCVSSSVGSGEV